MTDEHVIRGPAGSITIAHSALAQVVRRAADAADGARARRPRRGLEIGVEGARATVTLELAVRHGAVLPVVAEDVQRSVADALMEMCGLDASIDVSVEELD